MTTLTGKTQIQFGLAPLPEDEKEAVQWLLPLVHAADTYSLQDIDNNNFKRGWYAIGFLYADLYPGILWDENTHVSYDAPDRPGLSDIEPRLVRPFYEPSGWPVVLVPVVTEAWRRYEARELDWEELYCKEAVLAGMCHRNPELAKKVKREREQLS